MNSFNIDKEDTIIVKPEDFKKAVLFARKNKNSGIWIRYDMNNKPDAPHIDFGLLQEVPTLSKFGFSEDIIIKRIDNIAGIYFLKKLKSLTFYETNYDLDLAQFQDLEGLAIKPPKKIKNLTSLKRLDRLNLLSVDKDLESLKSLVSISNLRLTKGSIVSLESIAYFKNLINLEMYYLTKLKDCDEIGSLPKLKRLYIEKCNKIKDFDFLKENQTIQELFVSDINTISFVEKMKNLKKLKFWNLKDGDLSPALKSKTLNEVDFFPDKKHYSHSKQEINNLLNAKK